jgi:DNA-binding NarL/FixJ family response regulator
VAVADATGGRSGNPAHVGEEPQMHSRDRAISVAIVSDSLLLGDGLAALLDAVVDIEISGRARGAEEAVALVDSVRPDVLIVSLRTAVVTSPELIAAARALRRSHPDLGVVVLSDRGDGFALELLRGGSAGIAYLLDDQLPDVDTVVRAVRLVAEGQTVLAPSVLDMLVRRRDDAPIDDLTVRELDVLEQMAYGASNAAIAESLHLSVKAVERHVSAVFRKLGFIDQRLLDRRVSSAVAFLRSRTDPFA